MTAAPQAIRYRWLVEHRKDILTESLLVLLNLGVAVWLVDRQIPAYWNLDRALSLTVAFVIVQAVLIGLLLVAMFSLKVRDKLRARRKKDHTPEAVAAVTAIARGEIPVPDLRKIRREAPQAVEAVLEEALGAQRGEGLERLAAATAQSGILEIWRAAALSPSPARRCEAILRLSKLPSDEVVEDLKLALDDPEELVAVEAARALLARGTASEARTVFEALPRQSVLVQALLLPPLRRHASKLVSEVFPEALQGADEGAILMALSALTTWKRMVPLPDITRALRHAEAQVRAAAFAALPYVLLAELPVAEIRAGLQDADQEVRAAAAEVVGRKQLSELIPELSAMIREGGEPARHAAQALALFGGSGVAVLEAAVLEGRGGEQVATEALERYRLGRGSI